MTTPKPQEEEEKTPYGTPKASPQAHYDGAAARLGAMGFGVRGWS